MKNYYASLFILTLSIYGCSSVKENLSPVNTYLNSKLESNETVIVIEDKINNNYTIDLLKERSIEPVSNNSIEKSIGLRPPLYNKKCWDIMNKKYRTENADEIWLKNTFWNQNDFRGIKIKFIREEIFPKPYVYNEYLTDKQEEIIVFSFSEPIFYKNKKYALFAKAQTTTKKQFIIPNSIVVMKKEKGKWVFFQEITNGEYY